MIQKHKVQTKYKKIWGMHSSIRPSLTSPKYRFELDKIIEAIFQMGNKNPDELKEIFTDFQRLKYPLTLRLAAKIAYSYGLTQQIQQGVCVSVIFPVFNEKNRLHRAKDHPHGENFLRTKIKQLEKLSHLNSKLRWQVIIVDDGSTDGTGHIINYILEREYPHYLKNKKIQVLFMKDALREHLPYLSRVKKIQDAGKGSSILYGMDKARKNVKLKPDEQHILIYTDADLSVHLGQIGIVAHKMINEQCDAVIGQRRLSDAVIRRPKFKSARGKLYIYCLKQIIPLFKAFITDPQAPFKAIKEKTFKKILKYMREPGFSFDVEFLLLLKFLGTPTCNMGIGFIDSTKESHTNSNTIHLNILKNVLRIRKTHLPRLPYNSSFEEFIHKLTPEQWIALTKKVPELIQRANPSRLDSLDIPIEEFIKITKKVKKI